MGHFCLFSFISATIVYIKMVDFSGNQTRIVGVEGEHADHLTTTTAQLTRMFALFNLGFY